MSRTRFLTLAGAAGLVLSPSFAALVAQGPMLVELNAARRAPAGSPVLGGLGFVGYSGIFGLRLGGALNVGHRTIPGRDVTFTFTQCDGVTCHQGVQTTRSPDQSRFSVGGWTADADVLVEPFRTIPVVKSVLLGFSPYAFFGIGGYGVRPINARDTTLTTLSYGLGAHHDVLGWLGVDMGARYRRPLGSDSALSLGSARNWEYRIGLTASFSRPSTWGRGSRQVEARSSVEESRRPRVLVAYAADPTPPPSRLATRLLNTSDELIGTRYRSGGVTPRTGFDGAGFVQYVFQQEGLLLPHSARRMSQLGDRVSTRVGELRPGDLLFFANDHSHINHVAIYAGRERIVHATSSGSGVRYDVLGEGDRGRWFADHLVTARRILSSDVRESLSYDDADAPDRAPKPAWRRIGTR